MRTLKYFGIQAEKMIVFDIIMGIAYGFIFGTMLTDHSQNMIAMTLNYFFLMGVVTIIVMQANLVRLNMPLALSMGAGRKEAFWGGQWTIALLIAQVWIVCLLAKAWIPADYLEYMNLWDKVLLHICIAAGALSEILAVLVLKFGNKGVVIGTISISLVAVFAGITEVNGNPGGYNAVIFCFSDHFELFLFLFVTILYAAVSVIYYQVWKKYELKAL